MTDGIDKVTINDWLSPSASLSSVILNDVVSLSLIVHCLLAFAALTVRNTSPVTTSVNNSSFSSIRSSIVEIIIDHHVVILSNVTVPCI